MAHIVPKREPCVKCGNPVFLAERLVIKQSLYHRTCLRCARCNSLLTIGNFYETENDHEFCCETCPDEEKSNSNKVDMSNRLSIAQKIAIFEKESSNVLKKSLSDEEKSKSLSRQVPVVSSSASSAALNTFLAKQVKPTDVSDDDNNAESSSESDSDVEHAPPIPSNHPSEDNNFSIADHKCESLDKSDTTKELMNHINDTEAIAENILESPNVKDKVPEAPRDEIDEFELEFERIAEDAVKSPIVPIIPIPRESPVKIIPTPAKREVEVKIPEIKLEEKQPSVEVEVIETVEKTPELFEFIEKSSKVIIPDEPSEVIVSEEKPIPEIINYVEPLIEPIKIEVESLVEVVKTEDEPAELIKTEDEPAEIVKIESNEIPNHTIEIEKTPVESVELESNKIPAEIIISSDHESQAVASDITYPGDLNPFGDDEGSQKAINADPPVPTKRPSLNPFGDESEDESEQHQTSTGTLPKPPRPPLPKAMTLKSASTNPFGSDDEEDDQQTTPQRTPVPTPRKSAMHSITPEPTPRFNISNHNSPGHSFKGSTSSLSSSTDGMSLRRRKKKAPAPPPPIIPIINVDDTPKKTPSGTPRKKRPAPTPPTSTPKVTNKMSNDLTQSLYLTAIESSAMVDQLNESSIQEDGSITMETTNESSEISMDSNQSQRRLIPLEESLIEDGSSSANQSQPEAEEVTYRRKIVPLTAQSTIEDGFEVLERMKDNKEAQNRQRQSQGSLASAKSPTESNDSLPYLNKSSHGKWKRRKGPAPALPAMSVPQRRILQMLPLQEIRHELEVIEVQQQGLEKQGVMLEKMIRERCEGPDDNRTNEELLQALPTMKNSKEVEELIMQLFELVNEKNELFRRQAELMYLRRMHRLEEEQADVEFEIRKLMAEPEQNKTDSDKSKEEALIARLVEIVQLRNEVVDCLEMDRLREAEEDLSIKQRMESHTAKLDQEYLNQTPTKLSKKEKKKLKEAKKLKNKKLDADKDLDTSEIKSETSEKTKKKRKKFLF